MEGGHYMDLQKLQGCRCLGGPVAGVLVAGGSVMALSTVMAVSWDRFPSWGNSVVPPNNGSPLKCVQFYL